MTHVQAAAPDRVTDELIRRLEEAARAPVLLVASDYDGTLAPIVSDPSDARPQREALVALRELSRLANTHAAVISGRAIRDLAALADFPSDVHLVGSHGSEFDLDFAERLPRRTLELREKVVAALARIAESADGLFIEEKPASVALHYRNADEVDGQAALRAVLDGPARLSGVTTKHGKKVIELTVVATDKGRALEVIRRQVGASAVVYLGDDRTDEDAFATLAGPDVGIKVGEGESRATHRVESPTEVAALLAHLCEHRSDWLAGSAAVPIEAHSMLTDQRTLALVTPDARVVWLCVPRADSPALFAELVGGPAAGHFSVTPLDAEQAPTQAYVGSSFVLRTVCGDVTVTDYLDCSRGRAVQRAGRAELVRVLEGRGRVKIEFAPRIDFGRIITRLEVKDGGLVVEGALDPIVLHSPGVAWKISEEGLHHTATAVVDLVEDRPLTLDLRYGVGTLRGDASDMPVRREATRLYWSDWADGLRLPGVATELVLRSALVLKGLCYGPTGAILAAGTTSLPEHMGGIRNWDYRYSWLRDAAMSASALVRLGSLGEAMRFLDWMLGVIDRCESPEALQPLYTVVGGELGAEAEIGELTGYAGSRPVRVGNAASRQVQLDVFGPVVDLVWMLAERDAPLSSEHWRLVEAMVQAVERRWQEPDHGIWEIRKPRRHHVHSKVMCWVTVDRAIRLSRAFLETERAEWNGLREWIRDDVLEHGYHPEVGAFTAAYDDVDLDAAALCVGLTGMLPPDDPRFVSTLTAVERTLRVGPTVYRYRADDGLPGSEGGFHLCTGWLIDAYRRVGRLDDARALFEDLCALAGPTGMLSEQYGARSKRALGNTPQAYSHIAVIESALGLERAPES